MALDFLAPRFVVSNTWIEKRCAHLCNLIIAVFYNTPYPPAMRSMPGDKVQVPDLGQRGVVCAVHAKSLVIKIDGSQRLLTIPTAKVRNYSLAARKAWKNSPSRPVGRPKGSGKSNRVSVTLRIDREIWTDFTAMEQSGRIIDRTSVINGWLAEKLNELARGRNSK